MSSGNITVKGGVSGIDGGTAGVTVPAKREIRLIFLSDGWHSSYNDYCNVTEKEIATSAVTTEKLASGLTLSGTTSGSFKGTLTGNATNVTGVVAVANGGTGASTATQAINNLATGLEKADGIPTDAMGFITTDTDDINVNASDLKIYRRSGLKVWDWVQNKISSVLGLTKASYGGNAATASYADSAGNADSATYAKSAGSAPASDVYSWAKASTKPSYSKSEVGLGNVDNTADSAKSVRYAASAGSVAWSNVSGKPAYITGSSTTDDYGILVLNLYTN